MVVEQKGEWRVRRGARVLDRTCEHGKRRSRWQQWLLPVWVCTCQECMRRAMLGKGGGAQTRGLNFLNALKSGTHREGGMITLPLYGEATTWPWC